MPRVKADLTFRRIIPKSGNWFSDKVMRKENGLV